jgi:REP element-mobilizing transposase RayT
VLFPGALYHVFARGNERRPIFGDETDYTRFLELLESAIARYEWVCQSYCLMTNHYHLLVETPRANLPAGMRHLNGCYTQDFNRRRKRVGHLFQGRYMSVLVEKELGLLSVVRYIARNPIRAGMCERPEEWRWSSYAATIGEKAAPPWLATNWLIEHFGGTREQARQRLRAYVESKDAEARPEVRGVFLGSDEFIREQTCGLEPHVEIPRKHWQPIRPPLSALFATHDDPVATAYREWGYTLREIAGHLGCHYSTVSRRLRRSEQASPDPSAAASSA